MSDDWLERWQEGRTGWHEAEGNKSLKKHWTESGKHVLVPLCGKSKDLIWLEQKGNEVVGVELSEIATEAFFEENNLSYTRTEGELTRYVADERQITIYCGDYFRFSDGPFDGYYDRGALVAIAPGLRDDYVKHTRALLSDDAVKLIISVEYDQSITNGPPYSLSGDEMHRLWPGMRCVDAYDDMENCPPKFLEAGLDMIREAVWR